MSAAGARAHAHASQIPPAACGVNASASAGAGGGRSPVEKKRKPPFRPAPDDTKPVFRDPISRSDPVEAEQAVLLPPPFP